MKGPCESSNTEGTTRCLAKCFRADIFFGGTCLLLPGNLSSDAFNPSCAAAKTSGGGGGGGGGGGEDDMGTSILAGGRGLGGGGGMDSNDTFGIFDRRCTVAAVRDGTCWALL